MSSNQAYPRNFVPEEANLGDWESVEPLLQELLERDIGSPGELERWFLDHSELLAGLSEERSGRYIAMTCDTEDVDKERRYLEFIETIVPRCKPYFHRLHEKYLRCRHRRELDSDRFAVLDRHIEAEVEIFREANIPLQTEDKTLSQKYQKLCGAMTVAYEGEERTLPQMAKYYEETDRAVRQQAWGLVWQRRLEDREEFDSIFDRLVELRHQIARNAVFPDYRGYAFKSMKRFDYTIGDAERFHEAVRECVVPLVRRLNERRRELLDLEVLCPWDLEVDPLARPPLRPFEKAQQLSGGVRQIISRLDGELERQFAGMLERGELDLESRRGKAPGGYMSTRDQVRRPFIFMNAAGMHGDVETLLHESGHAFHSLAARDEPLVAYRHAPIEFSEVASMTMELFGDDHLDVFYGEEEAARAKRKHLERVIGLFPWIAQIDAFQHWVYAHPDHDREARTRHWLELDERFGPAVDWEGYEEIREASWQRQLHIFLLPFYYIEYGIAQLGALQIWRSFKERPTAALASFRSALALGGSRPLPELFRAAGARLDFSAATIAPLIEDVENELDSLPT